MILPLFVVPTMTIIFICLLIILGIRRLRTIPFDLLIKLLTLISLGTSLAYAGYL